MRKDRDEEEKSAYVYMASSERFLRAAVRSSPHVPSLPPASTPSAAATEEHGRAAPAQGRVSARSPGCGGCGIENVWVGAAGSRLLVGGGGGSGAAVVVGMLAEVLVMLT